INPSIRAMVGVQKRHFPVITSRTSQDTGELAVFPRGCLCNRQDVVRLLYAVRRDGSKRSWDAVSAPSVAVRRVLYRILDAVAVPRHGRNTALLPQSGAPSAPGVPNQPARPVRR